MRTAATLLWAMLFAAAPAAAAPAEPEAQCLACHGQQGLTKTFEKGEALPLHVDAAAFAGSVHAAVGCGGCHAAIDLKKHPAATRKFESARAYSLAAVEACRTCHQPVFDAYLGSMHGKARDQAGSAAPICADCHRPHAVTRISGAERVRDTCLTCHANAPAAHESWLPNTAQHLEMVACAACHAPGAQRKVDLRLYDAAQKREVTTSAAAPAGSEPLDETRLRQLLQGAGGEGKVTLIGRVEVSSGAEAHALADKKTATKDCTGCHRKGAEAFQNVTVSLVGPDGQRVRYAARKEILHAPTSVDALRGFYAVGGTRITLLDALLALALAGGISAPLGHLIMRRLTRKKDKGNA